VSPKDGGRLGAPHMADIPLVFDNVAAPGSRAEGPTAQPMPDAMSGAFIAFARSGDPNVPVIPRWTPYGLPRRQTMIFDVRPHMADDPRGADRRFFDQVPFVQAGP